MRLLSFALTTPQFLDGSKDVTRRMGWLKAKAGDELCAVKKCMGFRPGESVERLGVIRLVSVRRESLRAMLDDLEYGFDETRREGFPKGHPYHAPNLFVAFFCGSHKGCRPDSMVTRLEFERISSRDGGCRVMRLTEADFNGWRFQRNAMHFNGGKVFFGWGHRCVDQPRLLVIDKYYKADRSTKRSYLIDEKTPCETLDEALAPLSAPPTPSAEELGLLRAASDEWYRPEKRASFVSLAAMGFIEWGRNADNRVTMRRTSAGRAALAQSVEKK